VYVGLEHTYAALNIKMKKEGAELADKKLLRFEVLD